MYDDFRQCPAVRNQYSCLSRCHRHYLGFAAQRSIATLLAGLQLAITQPIRIDDVVIVDGEWGQIEEITLTYVVVRLWDLRRLVVPTNYFLEKSFQN